MPSHSLLWRERVTPVPQGRLHTWRGKKPVRQPEPGLSEPTTYPRKKKTTFFSFREKQAAPAQRKKSTARRHSPIPAVSEQATKRDQPASGGKNKKISSRGKKEKNRERRRDVRPRRSTGKTTASREGKKTQPKAASLFGKKLRATTNGKRSLLDDRAGCEGHHPRSQTNQRISQKKGRIK